MSNYVILVVSKKHKMRSRSTNHEALTVLCFVCFGILGDGDWGFSVQDSEEISVLDHLGLFCFIVGSLDQSWTKLDQFFQIGSIGSSWIKLDQNYTTP